MLGAADHPFVRGAAQPVLDLVKILDGLAEVVAGVLFDIALEWQRRCFQELKHAIHFLLRMASQVVVVQNKLWKVEVGHKGSQLSLLGLAHLDASHKRGSLKAHGGQPSVALLQVPLSPVFKQPPSVQGRDRQLEGVASRHQDDSKILFPEKFGEVVVVVHILQFGFEPNCHRSRTLPGVQETITHCRCDAPRGAPIFLLPRSHRDGSAAKTSASWNRYGLETEWRMVGTV